MNKLKIRIILIFIIIFGFFSIIFSTNILELIDRSIYSVLHKNDIGELPNNEKDCLSINGEWKIWGLAPEKSCQIPSKDAGKRCFSGFQCEYGSCLDYNNSLISFGECGKYKTNFGCNSERSFGLISSAICID